MQTQLEFSVPDGPADDSPVSPVDWVMRSYESFVEWKAKAQNVFFSVIGDSDASRNRVASIVRKHFTENTLRPEIVKRLRNGKIEAIQMSPPKITESNATYVDWVYIADLLLLHCACDNDRLSEENQLRETEYQASLTSYNLRIAVETAIDAIQENPHASNEDILNIVVKRHPKAKMPAVKAARKRTDNGDKRGITYPSPRTPTKSVMPLYNHLYFTSDGKS